MICLAVPRALPAVEKHAIKVLLISNGARSAEEQLATHSASTAYHREVRNRLNQIGVELHLAEGHEGLFEYPEIDFVISIQGGDDLSDGDDIVPLLCERLDIPFLGTSSVTRGLTRNTHLVRKLAVARGLPVIPWTIYRRGSSLEQSSGICSGNYLVRPNVPSACSEFSAAQNWEEVSRAVTALHDHGHDAIVEPYVPGYDIEVSMITLDGECFILP